jgi:hypothetical protein
MRWFMLVILATQEGRSQSEASLGKIMKPYMKKKLKGKV